MTDDLQASDRLQVATPEELAAAREARGMSQVDISQRIKLQVKQVNALELGEWDALPGRSFVRGALRSYGKLIDVDVSPLLESIGGFAEPTQVEGLTPLDAPIARSSGHGFNGGGRGSPILWVIVCLIGVVALVLYFGSDRERSGVGSWLRPGSQAPAGDSSAPQPSAAPAAPAGGMAAPGPGSSEAPAGGPATEGSSAAPVPSVSPSSGSAPPSGSVAQQLSVAAPATVAAPPSAAPGGLDGVTGGPNGAARNPSEVASAGQAPTDPAPSSSPPGATPQSGSLTAPMTEPATGPSPARIDAAVAPQEIAPLAAARASATEATAADSSSEAPAVVDTKGLIRVQAGSQDSWIEVRQADGSALHNGLVRAGESIDLRGTPPYRLVLGNASHLTLTYEGKARDLGPHMRANNIARLQLR